MKLKLQIALLVSAFILFSSSIKAQIQSAQSGEWTNPATWTGGTVPTSADDVHINATHEVAVSDATPECNSITFGADDATIDMNANGLLSVYGNFTLFSTAHNAFSGWSSSNSFIKFTGNQIQTLSGWNDAGSSTSFRDVIIDKSEPGDTIRTDGTGMRLCIQNSITIDNGVLELNDNDDLEGRWSSSGNYHSGFPEIMINAGGELTMTGNGWHHIRGGVNNPIGEITVYGRTEFRRASTNGIRINDVNIKTGGIVTLGTSMYSGTSGIKFYPGTITVENGGYLENYTTSDIWDATSIVDLQIGGTYKTTTTSTVFPANFTNNGIVEYGRTSDNTQVITDMDYNILKIRNENVGDKTWTLSEGRTIDSVIIEGNANLIIEGNDVLTVTSDITHTSGNIDAITSIAGIEMGPTATITELENNYTKGMINSGNRNVLQTVNNNFGGLGFEINAVGTAPGNTTIIRNTGINLGTDYITRDYTITPSTNTGLDATFVFHYFNSELNGLTETNLKPFFDDGSGWVSLPNFVIDTDANTVTVSGLDALYKYTLGVEPTITVSTANLDFGNVEIGSNSATQTYTVEGADLTNDIVITAPSNFEVSEDDVTYNSSLTITQLGGIVAQTTVYIRFSPTIEQVYSGNVSHESTDAVTQNITVTGTGIPVNNPPVVVNPITDVELTPGYTTYVIDITNVFDDIDGDILTYSTESSNEAVVTTEVSGTNLILNEIANGTADITVAADDGNGGTVDNVFSVTSTVSINELAECGINIYPNPSNGIFNISTENIIENIKITISDISGKTVYKESLNNSENVIDLSRKLKGLYFISIQFNSTKLVSKLVIK